MRKHSIFGKKNHGMKLGGTITLIKFRTIYIKSSITMTTFSRVGHACPKQKGHANHWIHIRYVAKSLSFATQK